MEKLKGWKPVQQAVRDYVGDEQRPVIIQDGPLLHRLARMHVEQTVLGFRRVDTHNPPIVEVLLQEKGPWYPVIAKEFDRVVRSIKQPT